MPEQNVRELIRQLDEAERNFKFKLPLHYDSFDGVARLVISAMQDRVANCTTKTAADLFTASANAARPILDLLEECRDGLEEIEAGVCGHCGSTDNHKTFQGCIVAALLAKLRKE
jgi:hypothetical protein